MKSMKKIIAGFVMAVFACAALLPLRAYAAEEPAISLQPEGDGANVVLTLPESVRENVHSLELSLKVESNAQDQLHVEFLFGESTAKIAEYRYHEDTGVLNLYLSGSQALFKEASLSLGKVSVSAANKEGIIVRVSVVEDSLKLVSGTRSEVLPRVVYPEAETIELGKGGSSGNEPGGGSGGPGGNGGSGGNAGESTNPVQTLREELKKTLELAKTYKKSDYTSDSFANLEKAMKAAEEVLNKQDASQSELEAALRDLENAIGALEKKTAGTTQKTVEKAPKSVKTGDNTVVMPWIAALVMSIGVIGFVLYRRIRYRR